MKGFEMVEGCLCVSVDALARTFKTDYNNALNAIKQALFRSRKGSRYYKHSADMLDSRKIWITLESLPPVVKAQLDAYYTDCESLYWAERMINTASSFVEGDDLPFFIKRRIARQKAEDLAKGCGWLRLCTTDWYKGKFSTSVAFQEAVAQTLQSLDLYGLKVSHSASLRRKVKAWKEHGRESLIPAFYGNNNAGKLGIKQQRRIMDLYCSPLKPSYRTVANVYNREATERGWPTISHTRVREILIVPDIAQTAFIIRHGEVSGRAKMERTIKRARPSFADALWTLDGTTVQLLYTDNGKVRSDLYIVACTDAYSRDVVGYAIGETETGALVRTALRTAAKQTGYKPYQLQYDNSSANKSKEAQELIQRLAHLAFPAAPYNGKAKVIEALYGHIEQQFLRFFPNFKGGNITAPTLNSKANPDHIKALIQNKELPTKEQAIAQVKLAIVTYRHTATGPDKRTPKERYNDSAEQRQAMDKMMIVELLWVERAHMATYTKDGITIEVEGVRHTYEVERSKGVENANWRANNLGERFRIMYDPDDLQEVVLFTKEWKYSATAARKWEAPMARADMQDGDGAIIAEALSERQEYLDNLRRTARQIREDVEADGLPVLDFALVHKDAYNRMEKDELTRMLEDAGRVIAYEETNAPRRRRKALYDDDSADGSLIKE